MPLSSRTLCILRVPLPVLSGSRRIGDNFASEPKMQLQSLRALCSKSFVTVKKGWRKRLTQASQGGRECPTHQSYQGLIYFFNWLLTIERYQTHSHSIHFKITELVRRFLRKRNMSLSKIYCCYIIISAEFKEKHSFEQDAFLCGCVIISSGLKESQSQKKQIVAITTESIKKKILCDKDKGMQENKQTKHTCPFLLLEGPGLLINLPKN